jgi:ADP-heptose:LPS heptosyltransferase
MSAADPHEPLHDSIGQHDQGRVSFHVKRRIDFWLGGFLLLLLFPLVRLLGLVLRRDHSLTRRRGCVVIKLVGAGSLFLALPSLQAIRREFPPGRFFLIGTRSVAAFAQSCDWFDACWVIDDSNLCKLLTSSVRVLWNVARHTDHLIDLEVHSRLTTVFGLLTMVRNRIGFVDEIVFWRRGFYTHTTWFNTHGPSYAFYDLLAQWFGIEHVPVSQFHGAFRAHVQSVTLPDALPLPDVPGLPVAPRLPGASQSSNARPLHEAHEALQLPARYVAIGHGCSDLAKERLLRPQEWGRVLRPLALTGTQFVFLGTASDAALADRIIDVLGCGGNLCGQLTLMQSAKVIAGATSFYGIDSLLLHLARALCVATTSFWGPTDPHTRLRPLGASEHVAFARMPCAPCVHTNETPPCHGRRDCIAQAVNHLIVGSPTGDPSLTSVTGWRIDEPAATPVSVSYA